MKTENTERSDFFEQASQITATYVAGFQVAHEYGKSTARFTAIRFAEWIIEENWMPYDSSETWINQKDGNKVVTTATLYDLFEHRNDWKQNSLISEYPF